MALSKRKRGGPNIVLADPEMMAEAGVIESMEFPKRRFRLKVSLGNSAAGALGGAFLWALVVYFTRYDIGLFAIGIGVLAGMGAARGGTDIKAQRVGAACAAAGYFIGRMGVLLALVIGRGGEIDPSRMLSIIPLLMVMVVKDTFTGINAVFLGFAVYEGYRIPAPHEPAAKG